VYVSVCAHVTGLPAPYKDPDTGVSVSVRAFVCVSVRVCERVCTCDWPACTLQRS
jgi:hypothetical protein